MCSDFSLNKSAVRTKNCSLNMPVLTNHQPLAVCRTDGAINRCMGSVSATSGPDTELQVPDEILQNFGMKRAFPRTFRNSLMILVTVCVCVFIKLHTIAQSGPVTLVILCHSH